MKRYSKNNFRIDKGGKKVYKTTYYPEIPLENADQFLIVNEGTRIDNLAFQKYGACQNVIYSLSSILIIIC